jgi:hypothetical protein
MIVPGSQFLHHLFVQYSLRTLDVGCIQKAPGLVNFLAETLEKLRR